MNPDGLKAADYPPRSDRNEAVALSKPGVSNGLLLRSVLFASLATGTLLRSLRLTQSNVLFGCLICEVRRIESNCHANASWAGTATLVKRFCCLTFPEMGGNRRR